MATTPVVTRKNDLRPIMTGSTTLDMKTWALLERVIGGRRTDGGLDEDWTRVDRLEMTVLIRVGQSPVRSGAMCGVFAAWE